MGSAGDGMFGTYHGGGLGSIEGNDNGEELKCPKVIENINLEDVATSGYYLRNGNVSAINSKVEVSSNIVNGRVVAILSETREVIGNIPVKYNFLNLCIKSGISYKGIIISSGLSPIPYTVVNLHAR